MVRFESKKMLLQREDFPIALKALKKIAKETPGFFHDGAGVAKAKELSSALEIAQFRGTFDAHGDLVQLVYVGDKVPRDAPDDFPDALILGWKKLLRDAEFELWFEGDDTFERTTVERGAVSSWDVRPSVRRFVQIGDPPRVQPGEGVDLAFRYESDVADDDAAIEVRPSDSACFDVARRVLTMRPGEDATLHVDVHARNHWMRVGYDEDAPGPRLSADNGATGTLRLVVDIPQDLDRRHEVVAHESKGWGVGRRDIYLHAKKQAAALEDMHRYAARHAKEEPFLVAVADAKNVGDALRAANLDPTFVGEHLRGLSFVADRLPGRERHFVGLLRSYAALTEGTSQKLRLAYASTPDWWTTLSFGSGSVRRIHEAREPA